TISAADFHTLLRSGGEVHGAILGLTRFGETECALARGLEVVARIGVGYDAIDVPALTRRRVPLMLVGTANSSAVAEHLCSRSQDEEASLTCSCAPAAGPNA